MTGRADTFNRGNSALLGSTPSDGGAPWLGGAGFTVTSNRAVGSGGSTWNPSVLEASTHVVDITALLYAVGNGGLVLRYADANNFVLVQAQPTYIGVYRRVAGTFTQEGSLYTASIPAGSVIRAAIDASNALSIYLDTTLRIGPITVSAGAANTKHGIVAFTSTTWEDFVLLDLAGGGGSVNLTVPGLTSGPTLGAVTITQAHELAVQGLSIAPTLAAPTITQVHTLAVATGTSAPTLDAVAITQTHELAVAGLTCTPTLSTPTLPGGSVFNLTVAAGTCTPTLATPAITQVHTLAVATGTSTPTLGAPAITQVHQLAVAGLTCQPTLAAVALGAGPSVDLAVASGTSTPALAALAITQVHNLTVAGLVCAPTLGAVAVAYVGPGGITLASGGRRLVEMPDATLARRSVWVYPL